MFSFLNKKNINNINFFKNIINLQNFINNWKIFIIKLINRIKHFSYFIYFLFSSFYVKKIWIFNEKKVYLKNEIKLIKIQRGENKNRFYLQVWNSMALIFCNSIGFLYGMITAYDSWMHSIFIRENVCILERIRAENPLN